MNSEEEQIILKRIKLIYDNYILPIIILRSPKLYNLISCKKKLIIDKEKLNENKKILTISLNNRSIPYTDEFINISAMILTVFNLNLEIKKESKDEKTIMTIEYDNYVIKLLVLYLSLYYDVKNLQKDPTILEKDICYKLKENYDEILCENDNAENYNNSWNNFKNLTENIFYGKSYMYKKYLKYKKKYIIIKKRNQD